MQIRQAHMKKNLDMNALDPLREISPNVILAFGDVRFFADYQLGIKLKEKFPGAIIAGCSSAGEIVDNAMYDDTLVVTALATPDGKWFLASSELEGMPQSRQAGEKVGKELAAHGPESVFVLAPGLNINGSEMVNGLIAELGPNVVLTGGLAGDGLNFHKTYTLANDTVSNNRIVAIGLKDRSMNISYGTQGGWNPFGPFRRVTRAENNILYEVDNISALELYKKYLGDKAKDLPESGLLYPLYVVANNGDENGTVRSILDIDEAAGSIMLAGDVSEGHLVRLMHAKTEALIDGAHRAGEDASRGFARNAGGVHKSLGILVSCVGRKAIMGDDANEEIAAVKNVFGDNSVLTGFYAYGEICPYSQSNKRSALHNQTMTVTRLTQTDKAAS